MATVVGARLEHPAADGSRLLRWASAGHLPPLLITPDHQARYLHMESAGHPLGVDPTLPRPDHERMLPAGAALLLNTDGLVEHRDQPLDEGMDQAIAIAASRAAGPLAELCDAFLAQNEGAFLDDVAIPAAWTVSASCSVSRGTHSLSTSISRPRPASMSSPRRSMSPSVYSTRVSPDL